VKQDPPGYNPRLFKTYRNFKMYKCTDIFMHPNMIMASPRDYYCVMLPDGTWLYSEGDDPNDILMFGQPRYARQAIDEYLNGQRNGSEA
jgi:hypothetical protein